MKQNRIHQRALSILLSFALVFSIFAIDTVGVSAASGDGRTTLWLDSNITISDSGQYVITQQDSGHPVTNTIIVDSGMTPDIELKNVNIDVSGSTDQCAFSIAQGAAVNLTLIGTNTLVSGGKCAGLRVPASTTDDVADASLTITAQSTGSLNVTGAGYEDDNGDVFSGAGIGGSDNESGGKITVNGGMVTAQGSENGAGIGGGNNGLGGQITANGGTVTAKGGQYAAGIGGGNAYAGFNDDANTYIFRGGDGGNIAINGGAVSATSGAGAGIGGGWGGNGTTDGGTISIRGGTVLATGSYGAGIGGGNGGNGTGQSGNITISGGTVTANGGDSSAGIGGGNGGDNYGITGTGGDGTGGDGRGTSSKITISGGIVTANGGCYGAGIGGGRCGDGTSESGKIIISGGTVTATGGASFDVGRNCGAGIGGGLDGSGGTVQINGADTEVTAQGQSGGHDIGSGYNDTGSPLTGGSLAVSDGATAAMISAGTDVDNPSYTDGCRIITRSGSGQNETVYGVSNPSRTVLTAALTAETDPNGGIRLIAKVTDGSGATVTRGSFTFTDSCVLNAQETTHTESAIINGSTGTASYDFDGLSSHGLTVLTAKYHDPNNAYDALKVVFYYLPDVIDLSSVSSGGYCYNYDMYPDAGANIITMKKNGWYVFTGSTTTNIIEVPNGISACVTLDHASINVSGGNNNCAFSLDPGATVSLILKEANILKSSGWRAGLEVPKDENGVLPDASLTITGQSTGSLNATGAGYSNYGYHYSAAGIGGNIQKSAGKITINGGTITANGGEYGAGIGGGSNPFRNEGYTFGNGQNIVINGGTVTATGSGGGAGIGGGDDLDGGTVKIGGSAEVHAYGQGGGHDIGSGNNNHPNSYTLSGGTLTVAGTDLDRGPTVELQSKGIDASAPDDTHQFTNCKIWGAAARSTSSSDISGCYDANGKIRLSAVLSAVPENPGSTVFGSPVTLTAANIARVGFGNKPTLSGKLLFLCDGHAIGTPVSLANGAASVDWIPEDAAEHHLTVQYQATDVEAYAINPEDVVPYPSTYTAGKATLTVTAPTAASAPYDSKLSDVLLLGGSARNNVSDATVPGSFSWANRDQVAKASGTYYAVFSPDHATDYNTVAPIPVYVNVTKATPTVITPPTASQITSGSKLSASTLTGRTMTDACGAAVFGTFAWAQPDTVVTASGNYEAVFTPDDTTDYNMASVLVPVTVAAESHSSETSAPTLPSGVMDTVSNTQADLSGATMPTGVTKVTLSVTPETANGSLVTPTTANGAPTPGTTGGTPDPQAEAAFHLAVSTPSLNIIGTPVLYNLKLLDQNGNPITGFSGKVTVRIPVPAGLHGTPHVFRYEESTGTFTDMNANVENGLLVFSTEHFSYYTVAGVGDSVTLDTKSYQIPVNGKYQIGLKLTGNKAVSVKVTSTNGKIAAVTKLKNGNVQVTGTRAGTAWIMFDVYDNKNHLLTHASVKIDVKTGIRPRGDSTRQIGVF